MNQPEQPNGAKLTAEAIAAMWSELDVVNWRKPPYYGMIARTAQELGISSYAGNSAVQKRQLRFGLALLQNKRALEKRIIEAYYGVGDEESKEYSFG